MNVLVYGVHGVLGYLFMYVFIYYVSTVTRYFFLSENPLTTT